MSVLSIKQLLYQKDAKELEQALCAYYADSNINLNKVEKAYRCYETDVLLSEKKICAGFGRTEEEATLNAARIALEALVDSAEQTTLETLNQLLKDNKKDPLKSFLENLGLLEYHSNFTSNKCTLEDLKTLSKEDIKTMGVPVGPSTRIFTTLNPNNPKDTKHLEELIGVESPPSYLVCPISKELMQDPVFTTDGHTYERNAITNWFRTKNTSPVTGLPLPTKSIRPNYALRLAVQHYLEVLTYFKGKAKPKLTSEPIKDLYRTVYGPQFEEPFEDLSSEVLKDMTKVANNALQGSFKIEVSPRKP